MKIFAYRLSSFRQVVLFALLVLMSPSFCASEVILPLQSKSELKSAVDRCLKLSRDVDCFNSADGRIGEWDVSRVIDMDAVQR